LGKLEDEKISLSGGPSAVSCTYINRTWYLASVV
jgi:hypothetical protein